MPTEQQSEEQLLFAQQLSAFFEKPAAFIQLCAQLYPKLQQPLLQVLSLTNLANYLKQIEMPTDLKQIGYSFIIENAAQIPPNPDPNGRYSGAKLYEDSQRNLLALQETAQPELISQEKKQSCLPKLVDSRI